MKCSSYFPFTLYPGLGLAVIYYFIIPACFVNVNIFPQMFSGTNIFVSWHKSVKLKIFENMTTLLLLSLTSKNLRSYFLKILTLFSKSYTLVTVCGNFMKTNLRAYHILLQINFVSLTITVSTLFFQNS